MIYLDSAATSFYRPPQVARAVGYESQSRFSSEFRRAYQLLPREYRRLHREDGPREGERRPAPDR